MHGDRPEWRCGPMLSLLRLVAFLATGYATRETASRTAHLNPEFYGTLTRAGRMMLRGEWALNNKPEIQEVSN